MTPSLSRWVYTILIFKEFFHFQERMSLLQTAQNSWQDKVGEKDVDKFTVAGKMGGSTPNRKPSRKESEMNAVNESHQQTVN